MDNDLLYNLIKYKPLTKFPLHLLYLTDSLIDARGEISHQDLAQNETVQTQPQYHPQQLRVMAQSEFKTSDV